MFTVRFPSGVAIQYNTAKQVRYKNGCWELYTGSEESARWIASIATSAGAVVESVPACRVYQAAPGSNEEILRRRAEHAERLHAAALARIRRMKAAAR